MRARELLQNGELVAAISSLTDEIKRSPMDATARTFLFELLCFAGDHVRAGKQLDAIGQLSRDTDSRTAVQLYQELLNAESARQRTFREGTPPRFLLEPPAAVSLHLDALKQSQQGQLDLARATLDRASEQTKPLRLEAAGLVAEDFRDGDDFLAPVLEVFSRSSYFWVPWEHLQYLEVNPPKNFRDLLWTPARLATFDGQLGEVFLPNLYPGTFAAQDDLVRLGRKTEWVDTGAGIVRGLGQKMFLIGDDARTLLELGELRFSFRDDDAIAPVPPSES